MSRLLPSPVERLDIDRIFSKRSKHRGIHEFRNGSIGACRLNLERPIDLRLQIDRHTGVASHNGPPWQNKCLTLKRYNAIARIGEETRAKTMVRTKRKK